VGVITQVITPTSFYTRWWWCRELAACYHSIYCIPLALP